MLIYLELSVVLFIAVIPGIFNLIYVRKRRRDKMRYSTPVLALNTFYAIGQILLISYLGLQHESGLKSIGLNIDDTNQILPGIFGGVVLASLFILVYVYVIKRFFLRGPEDEPGKEWNDGWQKDVVAIKSPRRRLLFTLYVSLAAISEELVFRGYFILLWGQRLDQPVLCAAISSIVFISLHLDRGRKAIPYYTTITLFLVIPTLYTHSLFIALGTHLYLNLLVTIGLWVRTGRKVKEKESGAFAQSAQQKVIIFEKSTPTSTPAVILFIGSFLAIPFSLFLFAIPSLILIVLAIADIFRIKRSQGKIVGIGFCVAAIGVSFLPILAFAAFFSVPYILDLILAP